MNLLLFLAALVLVLCLGWSFVVPIAPVSGGFQRLFKNRKLVLYRGRPYLVRMVGGGGPRRKYGLKTVVLAVALMAAGSATDGASASTFVYNAFANGALTATAGGGVDGAQEWLQELTVVTNAILTGQAANFASIRVTHRDGAGVIKNQMRVDFSAAGVVTVAFVPLNFAVANAAVVTGAGTGVLNVNTGIALPWPLLNGDTITLDRLSNNATGLATPAFSAALSFGVKS